MSNLRELRIAVHIDGDDATAVILGAQPSRSPWDELQLLLRSAVHQARYDAAGAAGTYEYIADITVRGSTIEGARFTRCGANDSEPIGPACRRCPPT